MPRPAPSVVSAAMHATTATRPCWHHGRIVIEIAWIDADPGLTQRRDDSGKFCDSYLLSWTAVAGSNVATTLRDERFNGLGVIDPQETFRLEAQRLLPLARIGVGTQDVDDDTLPSLIW